MAATLFDIDEPEPIDPLKVTLQGFALLGDISEPFHRIGQVVEPNWHLDAESICATREQLQEYQDRWGDTIAWSPIVVRVKVECLEVVE